MPMSNAGGASHEGAFTGLLADEVVNFPVTASTTVFDGAIWNVRRETFEFAGANVTREFIDHTGAVAVLAIDEHDRVCVITQYRHPIRAIEWELPAGLLDFAGEPALSAAKRELAEEVDLEASDWAVLLDFQVSPGGSNEALRVYLARGVTETAEIFERTAEESQIEKHWVPLDDLVAAVLARTIQNSILALSVLAADASRTRGWESLAPAEEPWLRHPLFR
jgi:8-oxo-dGTP pyrophosphatase MutT (NUDIX family)